MDEQPAGRPLSESVSQLTELALPNDANILGTLFGGKVMSMVDLAGSLAAVRHARSPVVTVSSDIRPRRTDSSFQLGPKQRPRKEPSIPKPAQEPSTNPTQKPV